jgi:magnesium-transporting ATPase (P-type)
MATMTLSTDDESSCHTNTIVMDTFDGEKVKMNTKNVDKKKKKKTKIGEKFKNLFPLLVLVFIIILVFIPQTQTFIGTKFNIRGFTLIFASAVISSSVWFIGDTLDYI